MPVIAILFLLTNIVITIIMQEKCYKLFLCPFNSPSLASYTLCIGQSWATVYTCIHWLSHVTTAMVEGCGMPIPIPWSLRATNILA